MKLLLILPAILLIGFFNSRFSSLLSTIADNSSAYFLFLGMVGLFCFLSFVSSYKLQDKISISEIKLKYSFKKIFRNYFILLGLLLSLISLFLHIYFDFRAPTFLTDVTSLTYFASVIFLGLGFWRISRKERIKKDYLLNNKDKFLFITLLIFSAGLRFYRFDSIGHLPEDILWIEHAFLILERIIRSPFLFIGDLSTNMPAYPVALAYLISNNVDFATRIPAILYDLLFLIALFFLCTEMFGKKIGFLALSVASFSIWDIHNGRLAWHNLSTNAPLITASLLFFIRSIKYKSYINIFFCGLALGLAFNLLYIPALMIGIVGLSILFYFFYLLAKRSPTQKLFSYILILLCILFVTIAPTLVKIYKYPDQSFYRHEQFLTHNIDQAKVQISGLRYYIDQFNIVNSNFGFNPSHYGSDGPWGPALNFATIFFCSLGLAYSITRFRSPSFFMITTTWMFMYIPVVLLYMTVSVWRLINFSPVVFIFTAVGINIFSELTIRMIPSFNRNFFEKLLLIGVALFMGWYAKNEYQKYFYFRTVENGNHIFQLCKTVENKINEMNPKYLLVPNDECGKTLYYVFKNKLLVGYYVSTQMISTVSPKTIVLERIQFSQTSEVLGKHIKTEVSKEEIRDDKSSDIIRLYYFK